MSTAHNETDTVRAYQVMDNKAVTIIDNFYDVTAPKEMVRVERHSVIRNALNVPVGLSRYNEYMGAVDTVDQMKGGHYFFETMHRTAKWNIKFFEMLLGLYQVQMWNIYRHVNNCHSERDEFQLDLILYFKNHIYHRRGRSANITHDLPPLTHYSTQLPLGSRKRFSATKNGQRYRGRCKGPCLRKHFKTTYYCFACKQFYCPGCMHVMHATDTSNMKRDKIILDIEKMDREGIFNDFKTKN